MSQNDFVQIISSVHTPEAAAVKEAFRLYRKAVHHGWKARLKARLTGQCFNLCGLAEADFTHTPVPTTVQVIPIEQIVGSENRSQDFTYEFYPLKQQSEVRWIEIAKAMILGNSLPPVELIKVGNAYYVRDGHHRISVAKMMGQVFIEARIN